MRGLGGKRVHELLHSACLRALALQLPPLCPWRWEEADGGAAVRVPCSGRRAWCTGAVGITSVRPVPSAGAVGNGRPRRQGRGTRIAGVAVLLEAPL